MSNKRLIRSKSGLRIIADDDNGISPLSLKEPKWIPDDKCNQCMHCQSTFTTFRRRHHCRRCGKCFCDSCSNIKEPLPRMCFVDPVRLCSECGKITQTENIFYDNCLRRLMDGAKFYVSFNSTPPLISEENEYICKLMANHKNILITTSDSIEEEFINLNLIDNLQMLSCENDTNGSLSANGLTINYRESDNSTHCVKLLAFDKTSAEWVTGMIKAIRLVYESRGECNVTN